VLFPSTSGVGVRQRQEGRGCSTGRAASPVKGRDASIRPELDFFALCRVKTIAKLHKTLAQARDVKAPLALLDPSTSRKGEEFLIAET
jgi:hypothetical protein